MVTEAARGPLANTLAVAATGQGLMLAGSLLARAVADLPAHQLDGVSFGTFYGVLGIGAGLSWWYSQRLKRGSRQPLRSTAAVAVEPGTVADATAAPSTATEVALPSDPFVTRLQQVIAGQDFAITHPLVQDDAGEYIQFNVRATKPGLFANDRTRSNVYNLLTNSVGGHWNYRSDPATDTLTFTRKAGFPAVVTPPVPNRIPQSTDEARQMYPDFRMRLGVTSSGEVLEINMAKFPHALFVGGSGSGKSVFARAVIESFRVAGWMIFLGDGKGTDYEGLHRQPGVVAISQSTADHIRMVRMVAEELRGRQADTQKRQRAGEQDAFRRPPLLLLLDEYATMLADIKSEYGAEAFESDLKFLTRVGRQFKVHVIFSTQEAYRDTINGQLLGNIGLRVSLGPPEDKTIKEVFPEKLRNEAARIGGTISKNDRGRGLALMTADDGTAQAVEFQSFYGYSPAEPDPAPTAEIDAAWRRYKTEASDRIPPLYPRFWFEVDGPDYAAELESLLALRTVRLTSADGTPRPGYEIYDPLSDDYLGGSAASGSVLEALDELDDTDDVPPPLPSPGASGARDGDGPLVDDQRWAAPDTVPETDAEATPTAGPSDVPTANVSALDDATDSEQQTEPAAEEQRRRERIAPRRQQGI
ncbi:hypothetical protein GS896_25380 [Rhodococcus hoagii]|nr:hypothetical protein [Prescottella equi]MBM4574907.1 hypothetical protein [Prescottella equi]MBM4654163.1 hypothetical protein [Prescottella equi]MBM4719635.1 hypothetical protein [Prescottella equi]NKR23434.1 hypothetical protein [Prescottella equi]